MITRSIKQLKIFKIIDESTQDVFFGCNQEWYKTRWQRVSGCGPSVVSSIMHYLSRTRADAKTTDSPVLKSACVLLMEDVWQYVTPTMRGIPSSRALCKGADAYIRSKGLSLGLDFVDIPEGHKHRPKPVQLLKFIDEALEHDTPVAFLNLSNGAEKRLDPWHWVTIVSLCYEEDGGSAFADIIDEGTIKKIDLALWLRTTTLGGGFVRFSRL